MERDSTRSRGPRDASLDNLDKRQHKVPPFLLLSQVNTKFKLCIHIIFIKKYKNYFMVYRNLLMNIKQRLLNAGSIYLVRSLQAQTLMVF